MQKSKHNNVYTDERDTATIETESHVTFLTCLKLLFG